MVKQNREGTVDHRVLIGRTSKDRVHHFVLLGCSIIFFLNSYNSLSWGQNSREKISLFSAIEKELSSYVQKGDKLSRERFLSVVKKVGICKEVNYGVGNLNEIYPFHDDQNKFIHLLEDAIVQGQKHALEGDREAVAYLFALIPLATDGALAEGVRKSIGVIMKPYPDEFFKGLHLCWDYFHAEDNDLRLRGFLTMLGDDFADDFQRQKIELEKRRNILENAKNVSEKIKSRCLSILSRAIERAEKMINSKGD